MLRKLPGRIGALKSCWLGGKKVVLLHRSGRVALVDGGTNLEMRKGLQKCWIS